jgi:nucleotide-binding universal stress UspA family protein
MKKFLIPVDFSIPSESAAEYAIEMTKDIPGTEIILYHVYKNDIFTTWKDSDNESRKTATDAELKIVKNFLKNSPDQKITIESEEGSFIDNISKYVLSNGIDMVIMGINGSTRMAGALIGDNVLNLIRNINTPIMIIPPNVKFKKINNVLFASDFKDVARKTPFDSLKKVLDFFSPKLNILNVDSEHFVELSEAYKIEKEEMEFKLRDYNPEFSFLRAYDFLESIISFAETKEIDAIITLPKKQGFINQLFKIYTKKLALASHIPIVAISM